MALAVAAAVALCALATIAYAGAANAYQGGASGVASSALPQESGGSTPEANLPYLFAVYATTWAAFFVYIFLMSRKQRDMEKELTALRAALQDKNKVQK